MSNAPKRDVGHETRDVRLPSVLVGTVLIAMMTLLAAAGMFRLYGVLADREADRSGPASPLASSVSRVPPEPRLQELPIVDLETLRKAEKHRLESYAWVDREGGIARVPIERAIDLLVAKNSEPNR